MDFALVPRGRQDDDAAVDEQLHSCNNFEVRSIGSTFQYFVGLCRQEQDAEEEKEETGATS